MSTEPTFRELESANIHRHLEWHGPNDPWTLADWSNAMCGEAGEAANIVKKIRRIHTGVSRGSATETELCEKLMKELADVVIYADLLASRIGGHLGEAVQEKFNEVSRRHGFREKL